MAPPSCYILRGIVVALEVFLSLQPPSLEVESGAHTNGSGSHDHNRILKFSSEGLHHSGSDIGVEGVVNIYHQLQGIVSP